MENQGLVHQVARAFRGRGVALEDLIQFGNIGLIRAAEKFEPERGLRFSTYAVYWIRQAIYKGIANTSRPIRVPLHARKEAAAVHRCAKSMEAESGTKPWLTEVLDAMEARGGAHPEAGAAAPRGRGRRGQVRRQAARRSRRREPPKDSPLSVSIDEEHREQLGLALELLCDEHRQVLTWRYGLDGSLPSRSWRRPPSSASAGGPPRGSSARPSPSSRGSSIERRDGGMRDRRVGSGPIGELPSFPACSSYPSSNPRPFPTGESHHAAKTRTMSIADAT